MCLKKEGISLYVRSEYLLSRTATASVSKIHPVLRLMQLRFLQFVTSIRYDRYIYIIMYNTYVHASVREKEKKSINTEMIKY